MITYLVIVTKRRKFNMANNEQNPKQIVDLYDNPFRNYDQMNAFMAEIQPPVKYKGMERLERIAKSMSNNGFSRGLSIVFLATYLAMATMVLYGCGNNIVPSKDQKKGIDDLIGSPEWGEVTKHQADLDEAIRLAEEGSQGSNQYQK